MEKIPQCDPFKAKYDACVTNWRKTCWEQKTIKTLDECNDIFQDYRDCITEGMKFKIAARKKKLEESNK